MGRRGGNLPGFKARQLAFSAHIRDPERHPRPDDVPEERMRVYLELFYNNIESFLASAFPIARQVLAGERWPALVRDFVSRHPSQSPYFLDISQEFLVFLDDGATRSPELPPWLLELCHYEWVELYLSTAEDDLPEQGIDPAGDLVSGVPVVSPLIWKLAYRYPVHRIGPTNEPLEPGPTPSLLLVYRRRDDAVRFMEINALTWALLDALDGTRSGGAALARVAAEVPALDAGILQEQGLETLERLRKADVILGIQT
jgi:uncharacterized protein